jgi:cobalt-zinc-cadmium efflux system outer membrane protein
MPFMPIGRRSLRTVRALVLASEFLALASTHAWAQAAPVVATPAATAKPLTFDSPPATHAKLTDADVAAPSAAEGGPDLPTQTDLPQALSLDDSLRIFHARGFGLLLADAAIVNASGVERAAAYVPNPQLMLGYGRALGYNPTTANMLAQNTCPGCSANQYTIALSDQAAIEDSIAGKRHLRMKVAHAALDAAKLSRVDAERTLAYQVKAAYFQVVQAEAAYEFTKDVQQSTNHELDLNQERLAAGKINDGDFERIRQTALESQQGVDTASQTLRQAKVSLAFLLGVRGRVPDFDIDKTALKFTIPPAIGSATPEGLIREAVRKRPDLASQGFQEERARASIALAKRLRIPDIAVGVQYTQTGTGQSAIQPPTLGLTLTGNLPIFYQQQGEIIQAEADLATQRLTRGQTAAQVVSDVEGAYAAYGGTRALVERMESVLLASARRAVDITKIQWLAGKANLTDYLDARQAFIQTNVEYLGDLTNYWTAVAQLEAAVGMELRK